MRFKHMRDQVYSTRIEDYLAAIEGCDAFFVAERDYGRIINYRMMAPDVFPDPHKAPDPHTARLWGLRRQCRGLVFNLAGDVISPGFDKFRNVNECEETLAHNIDWSVPHVIMEKLDGSLIRPIPMSGGGYRLATKMGLTDIAAQPEAWLRDHGNYDCLIEDLLANHEVPLFEWCSRKNRIVIDYPEDRLVLLAVRNVRTGAYLPLQELRQLGTHYGVEVVQQYPGTAPSMIHLLEETRGLQDQEGWIIWFDNGYRVKVKAESYLRIHKAKDRILRENGVIEMLLDETIDDVKSFLPEHDRHALECYEREFWQGVQDTAARWQLAYKDAKSLFGADRKTFAIEWAPKCDPYLRASIFKAWDDPNFDFRAAVMDAVRKNLGTQNKVNDARYLWGHASWNSNQKEE